MQTEMNEKFAKLGQLYKALDVAKKDLKDKPGPDNALAVQQINKQIASLRATFPKMRLVAG